MDCLVSLKKIPHLALISRISRKHDIGLWLVGGFLRDSFIGIQKPLFDFDFCVEKNTYAVAREFSQAIGSKYIVLDKEQESLRVVLRKKNKQYHFDFSRMRAASLEEDLRLRDFTINTLAVDLKSSRRKLIDCLGAIPDLQRKVIRVPSEGVIAEDPLRILRGFVFAACYDFRIDPGTLRLMCKYKTLLKRCAGERIAQELFKLFLAAYSYKTIVHMDSLGVLEEIIPFVSNTKGVLQGSYHHLDVWAHSVETLRQFELLYGKKLKGNNDIFSYLNEEIAQGRNRMQLIKLACLLHDVGKPLAKKKLKKRTIFYEHEKIGQRMAVKVADGLRLSSKEKDVLKKLIFWHLRPGYLADQIRPTRRAIYHYFRDTQEEGIAVILLSLSDWRATRGPLTSSFRRRRHERIMLKILFEHIEEQKKKPLPKLVDGNDIMKKYRLASGPLVGLILKKINEAQVLGKITTKSQAYRIARHIVRKQKGKRCD